MTCIFCGKPITLSPTAKERSKKSGLPVSYYNSLFDSHTSCELKNREKRLNELLTRLNNPV